MSFLDSIFGGGDETYVGTAVTRVIKDDMLPDAVKTGLIKGLFQNGNLVDYIGEEIITSIGVRADRMYAYAKAHYSNGLPSGQNYVSTQGRQQVENVIEAIEGQQVAIQYSHYGPMNALHWAWKWLITNRGYVPSTNVLASLSTSTTTVYLEDMVVQVPTSKQGTVNPLVLEGWGTPPNGGYSPYRPISDISLRQIPRPTPPVYRSDISEMFVLVTYSWMDHDETHTQTFEIPLTGFEGTGDYFQAMYTVGGVTKYWYYKNKSGTYPTLDDVYTDTLVASGDYFPFLYFRYNKTQVNADKTSNDYITTNKALKKLGMDINAVCDSIAENPDIDKVEQAFLTFAVPPTSTNAIECRYLFEYFDELNYTQDGQTTYQAVPEIETQLTGDTIPKNSIVLKDQKFRMMLMNSGISKSVRVGSIGSMGSFTATKNGDKYFYRKQITEHVYEEVVVSDLTLKYYVFGNYATTSDSNDKILLIPIDRTFSEQYTIPEREELYARSLHVVFNSRVVQHVAWYQTGLFQAVMIVVAIVLTIADMGADGGSWISGALGLSGSSAILATVVFNLAVGQLIAIGFKVLVKAVGPEIASALAFLAFVYGAYTFATEGMSALPTASKLLQLSTGLQSAVMQSKFADLTQESAEFNVYTENKSKLLEDGNKLLEQNHNLEPIVLYGEPPEGFYNRTVHFGNIGTLGITAVSSYVDIALTLPKIYDTLGEYENV